MDQRIQNYIEKLPPSYQEEVVDFLVYLLAKVEREQDKEWSKMSLAHAMRGMEDELSEYTIADLKVAYR